MERLSLSAMLWLSQCLFFMQAPLLAQEPPAPLPELDLFLQEIRNNLRSDRLLLSQYTYIEKNTERRLDKKGNVKKIEENIYEVYPSLEEGLTYRRLIMRNGIRLSEEELIKQDRAQDKKVRERLRKLKRDGSNERDHRNAKEAEEKRKEDRTIEELFRLYHIEMAGRDMIAEQPSIELRFRPRTDYKPMTRETKILAKLAGRAWFGEEDRQMIRIEADLIDNISIGLGILGRLNKGAHLVFQRRKVNDEIWLPAEAHFTGNARLLLLKGLRLETTSEYMDYKKFAVETSISYPSETDP